MRAVVCKSWGDPSGLVVGDLPEPSCGPRQVIVQVKAWGVNYADLVLIGGQYHLKPAFPFAPGMEVAGEIIQTGSEVTEHSIGERVCAMLDYGGFADLVAANEEAVMSLPSSMEFVEGAGFLIGYSTAYVALCHRAGLRKAETLVVLGAGGGVGLAAVAIGRAIGARVVAVASTDEKLEAARRYGATDCINYSTDSLRERVKQLTGGRGADVVFDPVGGDAFDTALRCVAFEGRIVVIGFASGRIPSASAGLVLVKGCSVIGSSVTFTQQYRPDVIRQARGQLVDWHSKGMLPSLTFQTLPFAEAPSALSLLAARSSQGRIVLRD